MFSSKTLTVFLAGLMLSISGCSGGKLRNLTAKSEFRTLEEIESPSAIAAERKAADKRQEELARSADQSPTATVAHERTLAAGDSTEESKERVKRFSFTNPFRRKADTEEFSPDPFVTTAETETNKSAHTNSTPPPVDRKVTSTTETQSGKSPANIASGTATIAEVEKQAQELFAESLAKQESVTAATKSKTLAETKTAAADTAEEAELSFADFLEKHQGRADENVEATTQVAVTAVKSPTENAVRESPPETSSFDAFLNEAEKNQTGSATNGTTRQIAATESNSPFTGFDAFDAQPQTDTAEDARTESADVNPFSQDAVVAEEFGNPFENDPFEETTRKHGFTRHNKDPWAALTKTDAASPEPAPQKSTSDSFAWNDSLSGHDSEVRPATNAVPATVKDTEFRQVSLTRPTELSVPKAVDISQTAPLVIPGNSTSGQRHEVFEEAAAGPEPTHLTNDPFLTSVPFESVGDDSDQPAETVTAVAAVATTKSGTAWLWSGRTWFLLIGCLIVAFLLFAPDRKNQTNS
ncbi:MAG: hypothetical protein R3C59_12200 [Planctomycetaceae bacterium]